MICLHSIPSGEEWVLVLHGSQHPHETRGDLQEFPDHFFLVTMIYYNMIDLLLTNPIGTNAFQGVLAHQLQYKKPTYNIMQTQLVQQFDILPLVGFSD